MEMYKRLLLTYVDKYDRLDTTILADEMRLTETQIVNIMYSLRENGFLMVKDQKYIVSEEGKKWVFPMWNEWSIYNQTDRCIDDKKFVWDYLYIPESVV